MLSEHLGGLGADGSGTGRTIYISDVRGKSRARVAIWFLKLKGPAAQLVLRDTGLDLAALRLTAADLERAGPAIVLDRRSGSGDRLLVWTE